MSGLWTDKNKTDTVSTRSGEVGIFRQEAVARVDGFSIRDFSRRNNGWHIQIAVFGRSRANTDRFVGQLDVFGVAIGFRMHHHGFNTQQATGALDAKGDFPPG